MDTNRTELQVIRRTGTLIHSMPDATPTQVEDAIDYGQVLRHARPLSNANGKWWQLPNGYVRAEDVRTLNQKLYRASTQTAAPALAFEPLSQRDPRWAAQLLGNTTLSSITINDFGCLLVCYTMLVNTALERKITVDQHNEIRRVNGNFASPGPWGGMATTFDVSKETNGRIKISWISDRTERSPASAETVRRLIEHLSLKLPAIIEVDFFPDDGSAEPNVMRQWGKQMHFVLATGVEAGVNNGEQRVQTIDPWDGQYKSLSPRFGNSNGFAITRVALYDIDQAARSTPAPAQTAKAVPSIPALGINTLWHAKSAQEALMRGCRWFTVANNLALARELNQRGALVAMRWIWGTQIPTVAQYFERIGELMPGAIYLGLNENEAMTDIPSDILKRAAFDKALALEVRKRSNGRSIYAGGSFAMGRPDFSNAAVCEAIRDGYAEAYNSGLMLINTHLYASAVKGEKSIQGELGRSGYLRHWENFFHRCGFDPAIRGIVSNETGLDQDGAGFIKNRLGNPEFAAWCNSWVELQGTPLTIDNKSDAMVKIGKVEPSPFAGTHTSPMLGGTLFQLSPPDAEEWRDHNLYLYLNELGQLWKRLGELAPNTIPNFASSQTKAAGMPTIELRTTESSNV